MTSTHNYRATVAEGNGMAEADLPRFRSHVHPETGRGRHNNWAQCAATWCTWAGSAEANLEGAR